MVERIDCGSTSSFRLFFWCKRGYGPWGPCRSRGTVLSISEGTQWSTPVRIHPEEAACSSRYSIRDKGGCRDPERLSRPVVFRPHPADFNYQSSTRSRETAKPGRLRAPRGSRRTGSPSQQGQSAFSRGERVGLICRCCRGGVGLPSLGRHPHHSLSCQRGKWNVTFDAWHSSCSGASGRSLGERHSHL